MLAFRKDHELGVGEAIGVISPMVGATLSTSWTRWTEWTIYRLFVRQAVCRVSLGLFPGIALCWPGNQEDWQNRAEWVNMRCYLCRCVDSLMPLRALIRRELVSTLRRWWPFLLLLLASTATAFMLFISVRAERLDGSGLLVVGYLATLLLVPAMGAAAFAEEREQGTLDLLRTSYLTAGQLLLAKLVNVTGTFLLLIVGMLPAVGVCFFYQGMDVTNFLGTLGLVAVGTLMFAAIGLRMSIGARTATQAVGRTYTLSATLMAVGALLTVGPMDDPRVAIWPMMLVFGNPISAKGLVLIHAAPVLIATLFLWSTWRRLRRSETHRRPWKIHARLARKRAARPIPGWVNPILGKDLLQNRLFSARGLIFFVLATAVAIVALVLFDGDTIVIGSEVFLSVPFAASFLLWPGIIAANLSREQGPGHADTLGSTLITPGQYARGKLLSACLPVWAFQAGSLLAAFVIWGMGPLEAHRAPMPLHEMVAKHALPLFTLAIGAPSLVLISLVAAAYARRVIASLLLAYVATFIGLLFMQPFLARITQNHGDLMGLAFVPGGFYVLKEHQFFLEAAAGGTLQAAILFVWYRALMIHHLRRVG